MESTVVKAVEFFLDQPEENLIDKDHWIVNYVVRAIESFTKISKIAVAYREKEITEAKREKEITEAKREDIATELSKIIYLVSCISHLCDIEPSVFEAESLTNFSREFDPDYQQDSILCAMLGMRGLMDISEELYVTNFIDAGEETTPTNPDEDPVEQSCAEIFACVIILCEHLDLDLEIVMSNSTSVFKKP